MCTLLAHPLSFVAAVAVSQQRPLGVHCHVPCLRLGGVGVTRTATPAYWHISKTAAHCALRGPGLGGLRRMEIALWP